MAHIRDRLALAGAQRIVTLGSAATARTIAGPQDGIEPLRRVCKWILNETRKAPDDRPETAA